MNENKIRIRSLKPPVIFDKLERERKDDEVIRINANIVEKIYDIPIKNKRDVVFIAQKCDNLELAEAIARKKLGFAGYLRIK